MVGENRRGRGEERKEVGRGEGREKGAGWGEGGERGRRGGA